ncbi:MAG: DedA family protein [Spirochaetes bacterium]|nr:DedA family protein [Spirochaetota bacterium]
MDQILQRIIDFLLPMNDLFLYLFLFACAVIENFIPPIPGDTIMIFGAFLVGIGRLNYLYVFLSTTAGSVGGFMGLFLLGRFLEREFFMKRDIAFFKKENIIRGERWFGRYGYAVVFFNRFLPGLRSVVSIVSGISLLNPLWVLLCALVSAGVWNLLWLQTGYLLGNNWETVKAKAAEIFARYNLYAGIAIAGTIALALLIYYFRRWLMDRRSSR